MASRRVITATLVPKATSPYSHAIVADKTVYVSGQVGFDPKTGNLVPGGFEAEAKQTLENLGNVLKAAGTDYKNVHKTTVLLTDINNIQSLNEIYKHYFPSDFPARTTYQVVALPIGAKIEIDAIATIGNH